MTNKQEFNGLEYLVDIDTIIRQQKQLVSDLEWEHEDSQEAYQTLEELLELQQKGYMYIPVF